MVADQPVGFRAIPDHRQIWFFVCPAEVVDTDTDHPSDVPLHIQEVVQRDRFLWVVVRPERADLLDV